MQVIKQRPDRISGRALQCARCCCRDYYPHELPRQPRENRGNRTRGSCLQQPTRTVRIGHGSPPFQLSRRPHGHGAQGSAQPSRSVFKGDCRTRPRGDSHRRRQAGLSLCPLLARRRALPPENAFSGTSTARRIFIRKPLAAQKPSDFRTTGRSYGSRRRRFKFLCSFREL